MTSEPIRASRPAVIAVLLSAAAVLAVIYFRDVHLAIYGETQALFLRSDLHRAILEGTADSPYRYRVLAPLLAEAVRRLLLIFLSAPEAFKYAYLITDFSALALGLLAVERLLRQWFDDAPALAGALALAALLPITLRDHQFQPWSVWEPAIYALALLLIGGERRAWLAVLVAAAALNRETAAFAVLLAGLCAADWWAVLRRRAPVPWRALGWTALYAAVWAAIFFGLRALRGGAPHVESLGEIWAFNTQPEHLQRALVNLPLFAGGFWALALIGARHAPPVPRRALWVIPPFLVLAAVYGVWFEVRMLLPLYPILIGCGLAAIFPARGA